MNPREEKEKNEAKGLVEDETPSRTPRFSDSNLKYSNASMVNKEFNKKTSRQQAKISQFFTADKQMVN